MQYSKKDNYPMHMPGHKRNIGILPATNPYSLDITEIEGFDNLHQAEGILRQLSLRISSLYHSGKSWPLINGSTAGILAGISAAVQRGDKVLVARNVHKSVYHAIVLRGLRPVYLYPEVMGELPVNGGISPGQVEHMLLLHPDSKLVIVTSPTYEGIVSDITAIAKIVHLHNALLLVDEAHGAHFGFYQSFPQSAVTLGADLIIQSFHKTLPSFTQTAVLHSNTMKLNHRIELYLSIYESSSPSYLLLAGIDRCITLLEEKAAGFFEAFDERLKQIREELGGLTKLRLLDRSLVGEHEIYDMDPSKLVIIASHMNLNGHEINRILREQYHIIMEMEAKDYVLALTSIFDTGEGFDRLSKAITAIDQQMFSKENTDKEDQTISYKPEQVILPWEAMEQETNILELTLCENRISAVFISKYPPGIPLIVPGELITKEIIQQILALKQAGLTITGLLGGEKDLMEVIRED